MEESKLRQQVCEAGRQLWLRRMISGDGGMVTAELHRRRYITTPTGKRRADLSPEDLHCVDLGGVDIFAGGDAIDGPAWRPHRLTYQGSMFLDSTGNGNPRSVHATILATPPNVMALLTLEPTAERIAISNHPPLPVINADDDADLQKAVLAQPVIVLPGLGVLAAGPDLDTCLNTLEVLEHHASIELATRGYRS